MDRNGPRSRKGGPDGSRRAFLAAAGAAVGGLGVGTAAGEPADRVTVGTGMATLDDIAAALDRDGAGLETVETDGFEPFLDGRVDVQHAARPMTAGERERAAEGVEFAEREFPVGGVAALGSDGRWCRCLSEGDREVFGDGGPVETWTEVDELPDSSEPTELPGSESAVLVRGTRAGQYAIGHGGVAYHGVSPAEFGLSADDVTTPVVRLGFAYVDRDALEREAVAGLVERYDDAASDAEPVPPAD